MASKERALDIFWLLGQLDKKRHDVWDELTDEQRKEVSPYMILRWLAGNLDEPEQLVNLADEAAPLVFDFGNDKELMLKVLTACTVGGPKRYSWVNFKVAGGKKSSLAQRLVEEAYKLPPKQAKEVMPLFSKEQLFELAEQQGWQADEVKELKKELGK